MTKNERWMRIHELREFLNAHERTDQPSEKELEHWAPIYRELPAKDGRTRQRDVLFWVPKPEYREWGRLRFNSHALGLESRRLAN